MKDVCMCMCAGPTCKPKIHNDAIFCNMYSTILYIYLEIFISIICAVMIIENDTY